MSNYVEITACVFNLKSSNYDKAYRAMCELNKHDELKACDSYMGCGNKNSKTDATSHKWFYMMSWDYDKMSNSVFDILFLLGFEVLYDDDGIYGFRFDSFQGQEELFFKAIEEYVENGSYIVWLRDDGYSFTWVFEDGKMNVVE